MTDGCLNSSSSSLLDDVLIPLPIISHRPIFVYRREILPREDKNYCFFLLGDYGELMTDFYFVTISSNKYENLKKLTIFIDQMKRQGQRKTYGGSSEKISIFQNSTVRIFRQIFFFILQWQWLKSIRCKSLIKYDPITNRNFINRFKNKTPFQGWNNKKLGHSTFHSYIVLDFTPWKNTNNKQSIGFDKE